jgi:hypothetical protein
VYEHIRTGTVEKGRSTADAGTTPTKKEQAWNGLYSFSLIPFHVFRKNNCTGHHKSSAVEEKRKMAQQLYLIPQFRPFLQIHEFVQLVKKFPVGFEVLTGSL